MKRGSANMWWIIIGAVIALVVLIILMTMFTGKTSKLESGLLECSSKGGTCVKDAKVCKAGKGSVSPAFICEGDDKGKACCFGYKKP